VWLTWLLPPRSAQLPCLLFLPGAVNAANEKVLWSTLQIGKVSPM
jgi:hypothetical protein